MNEIQLSIDNFRFFYLTLADSYDLPGVNPTGLSPDQKAEIVSVLQKVQPSFVDSFDVLPENRPARYATELHLVRPLEYNGSSFVLALRILAEYRGGAEPGEILQESAQSLTPRIRTNKIYYRARIVPCSDITRKNGRVIDFTPRRLSEVESVYTEARDESTPSGARDHTFAVFLDTDFSAYNARITERFGDWQHTSVFQPFVADDYVTVSLNVLYPNPYYIDTVLPYFSRAFDAVAEGQDLNAEDRTFWKNYYAGMDLDRFYSRAGNPHWRFTRLPWM